MRLAAGAQRRHRSQCSRLRVARAPISSARLSGGETKQKRQFRCAACFAYLRGGPPPRESPPRPPPPRPRREGAAAPRPRPRPVSEAIKHDGVGQTLTSAALDFVLGIESLEHRRILEHVGQNDEANFAATDVAVLQFALPPCPQSRKLRMRSRIAGDGS